MKPLVLKNFSANLKVFIAVAFIFAAGLANYVGVMVWTEKISNYNDLRSELTSVKELVAQLEYTLDMFIVGRRFENTTVELLKKDVEHIDKGVNGIKNPRYSDIIKSNPQLSESMNTLSNGWQSVKNGMARISESIPLDELMLIHNDIDVNVILINEMNDRIAGIINEDRADDLGDIKTGALATGIGFLLVAVIVAFLFYTRAYYPAMEASRTAEEIWSGSGRKRFNETGGGFMANVAFKLNLMLAALNEEISLRDKRTGALEKELKRHSGQIEGVNSLTASIARALSLSDVFSAAVKEAAAAGGADGAGVYMAEEGFMRLKASSGLDDVFLRAGSALPVDAFEGMQDDMSTRIFSSIEDFPYEIMRPLFKGAGFSSVVSVPVKRDRKTAGYFYAAFKDISTDVSAPFFEAVALNIEGFMSDTESYRRERNSRHFFESVINQMPLGIAAFDRDGACALASNHLKKLLNAPAGFNFIGGYNIIEDDAFKADDAANKIRNAYAGYTAEFTVEYAPSLTAKFGFGRVLKRFKIKAAPLYDLSGEISFIMLLYEPVPQEAPPAS